MGITLLCLGILITGILLKILGIVKLSNTIGNIFLCFGIILLLACLFLIIIAPIKGNLNINNYTQNKKHFDTFLNVQYITKQEKERLLLYSVAYNKGVLDYKYLSNNFWVSWFFYKPYGEMELFEIEAIPTALGEN